MRVAYDLGSTDAAQGTRSITFYPPQGRTPVPVEFPAGGGYAMDWQLAGGVTGFTHGVPVVSRAAMRPACVHSVRPFTKKPRT